MEQIAKKSNLFNGVKIIIATPLFPPEIESIAIYAKELAMRLKAKHQLRVLAYAGNWEEISDLKIYSINKRQPIFFRLINYFIKLSHLAKQADIIYAQNALASGLPAILVKIFFRKVVVINFFEDEALKRARHFSLTEKSWEQFLQKPEANFKINLIRKLQIWVLRRADKVLVSSQALAEVLSKEYKLPKDKIVVNYPAPADTLQLPFALPEIKQQIFVEAKLFSWSGIDEIIRAVDILKNKFTDLKLVIVGDGQEKNNLQNLVEELGLGAQVDFRGWVSQAERAYLLKSSQVVVYNPTSEDFSSAIVDYVVANKPIVSINSAYAREIFAEQASYLDSGKASEIAQTITKIFTSQQFVGANNQENFSWDRHISQLEKIFDKIL